MSHDHYPYSDSMGCPICEAERASVARPAGLVEAERKDSTEVHFRLGYAAVLLRQVLGTLEARNIEADLARRIREFLSERAS